MALFHPFCGRLDGIDKIVVVICRTAAEGIEIIVVIKDEVFSIYDIIGVNHNGSGTAQGANLTNDIKTFADQENGNQECPEENLTKGTSNGRPEVEPREHSLNQECQSSDNSSLFASPATIAASDEGQNNESKGGQGYQNLENREDKETKAIHEAQVLSKDFKALSEEVKDATEHSDDAQDEHGDAQEHQKDGGIHTQLDQPNVRLDRLAVLRQLAVFIFLLTSIIPKEVIQLGNVLQLADDGVCDLLAAEPNDAEDDEEHEAQHDGQGPQVTEVYHEAKEQGQQRPQGFQNFHVFSSLFSLYPRGQRVES